jgi:hypothetical protein
LLLNIRGVAAMALGPTESGALWTSGTNVLKSEQFMVELTHLCTVLLMSYVKVKVFRYKLEVALGVPGG